jgi:hypothetical protein
MSPTLKNLFAVIVALVAGGLVVYGFEYLIHQLYPTPDDIDLTAHDSLRSYMHEVNMGSLSLLLLAHSIGALTSGWVIGLLGLDNKRFLALITGLILTLSGVVNLVVLPHPIWFSIADTCVYMPFTLMGLKLSEHKTKTT